MKSQYESVKPATAALTEKINVSLGERGVFTVCTCPGGEPFGWDMHVHYAMQYLARHPEPSWHISQRYAHECVDWTVTVQ